MTPAPILTRSGPEMMVKASGIVDGLGILGPIHPARASDALLMGALIHAIILHRIGASPTTAHAMLASALHWAQAADETEQSLRRIAHRELTREVDPAPSIGEADK